MMTDMILTRLPQAPALVVRAVTVVGRPPAERLTENPVSVRHVAQPRRRLVAYNQVCGFAVSDTVPATWLHVLSFPLQAWLFARRDFPFSFAGVLHAGNDMTLLRPVQASERLDLRVHAGNARPHAKGVLFDMMGEAIVDGETVWRGTSTYLAGRSRLPGAPSPTMRLSVPDVPASQEWHLRANLGRHSARVSGDVNPIHLHPLTSRLFGLPKPIIHGMWTHARCLAALGSAVPPAYRVQVQFAKPLSLPIDAGFRTQATETERRFAVVSPEGKPYVVGLLTPL